MQGSSCLVLTWKKYRISLTLLNVDRKFQNYQNLMSSFGEGSCGWTDKRSLWSNTPRLLEKCQHRWWEIIKYVYYGKEMYFEAVEDLKWV